MPVPGPTWPGATAFTRTPLDAISMARHCVRPQIAFFDAM